MADGEHRRHRAHARDAGLTGETPAWRGDHALAEQRGSRRRGNPARALSEIENCQVEGGTGEYAGGVRFFFAATPLRKSLPENYRIEMAGSIEEATKANSALAPLFPLRGGQPRGATHHDAVGTRGDSRAESVEGFPMEADRRMTERMPSSVDPEIRQPAYALALSAKTSAKVL